MNQLYVPTQSLFDNDTKIGMTQTFSLFSDNLFGPVSPLRLTGFVRKVFK